MLEYLLAFYLTTTIIMITSEFLSFCDKKFIFLIEDYIFVIKTTGLEFLDIFLFVVAFPYFILLFIMEKIIKSFAH